jgi:hypothetical protein
MLLTQLVATNIELPQIAQVVRIVLATCFSATHISP